MTSRVKGRLPSEKEYTCEYLMQENVCRLCLKVNANIKIQKPMRSSRKQLRIFFKDIVKEIMGIEISPDQHPDKVCDDCFEQVHKFYKFRSICIKNDSILKTIVSGDEENEVIEEDTSNTSDSECVITIDVPEKYHKTHSEELEKVISQLGNIIGKYENVKNLSSSKKVNSDYSDGTVSEDEETTEMYQSKVALLKATPKRIRLNQNFSNTYCKICDKEYNADEIFNKHNSDVHGITEDGLFKCLGCSRTYKSRNTAVTHEQKFCNQMKKGYQCNVCGRYLKKRKIYEKHWLDHENNTDSSFIFPCNKNAITNSTNESKRFIELEVKKEMQYDSTEDEGSESKSLGTENGMSETSIDILPTFL